MPVRQLFFVVFLSSLVFRFLINFSLSPEAVRSILARILDLLSKSEDKSEDKSDDNETDRA